METTIAFDNLLTEFRHLPKQLRKPTYLELCKYPGHRFEEICSRLLCFYLAPDEEHGLGTLFLDSLFEILDTDQEHPLQKDNIRVLSEVNAEGKRIDMLIYSDNFAIGIENKISAGLYNPLETYSTHIEKYSSDNVFKIILSLKEITKEEEQKSIDQNGFTKITYAEYFEVITGKLDFYREGCNELYVNHLNDFIQTLENMNNGSRLDKEMSAYLYKNSETLDELVKLYDQHKKEVLDIQKERIALLREQICDCTDTPKWWRYQDWVLGFNEFNEDKPVIGIESYYQADGENPLAELVIFITAWKLEDWDCYSTDILKQYPDKVLRRENNRPFLCVDTIKDDNQELIVERLKKHYDFLSILTSNG